MDKGRENPEFLRDNADMLPVLDAALAADPKLRLLLMTDSEAVLETICRTLRRPGVQRGLRATEVIIPLTWQDTDARHRLGVEVIKDTYLVASCDRFIGFDGLSVA